jgi:hypothetical protein
MKFDKLYTIQYPSGSFGHFTHLLLSNYGDNFTKQETELKFKNKMNSGSSHFVSSQIKKYYSADLYKDYAKKNLIDDYIELTKNGNYTTVIIDSGITDDSEEFKQFFPGANCIKICYTDYSWPFSAKAFYTRCMSEVLLEKTKIDDFIKPEKNKWQSSESWELREKYFLFLRDHEFRRRWNLSAAPMTVDVDAYFDYNSLYKSFSNIVKMNNFNELYDKFYENNLIHIDWYIRCREILSAIQNNQHIDLTDITDDLFSQATINYYIQILYNFEIPAWDYRDWFSSTDQIFSMFDLHNISH